MGSERNSKISLNLRFFKIIYLNKKGVNSEKSENNAFFYLFIEKSYTHYHLSALSFLFIIKNNYGK